MYLYLLLWWSDTRDGVMDTNIYEITKYLNKYGRLHGQHCIAQELIKATHSEVQPSLQSNIHNDYKWNEN